MTVFTVRSDLSNVGDNTYMAEAVSFDDKIGLALLRPEPVDLPNTIYFEADFKCVRGNDFPYTNFGCVMSRRMYDIVNAHGLPRHKLYDVVMLDDTSPPDRIDPATNTPLPTVPIIEGYVLVHLQEHTDALDWERSDYKESRALPGRLSYINRFALKMPVSELPSMFMLWEKKSLLLMPSHVVDSLLDAGITGLNLEAVNQGEA